MKKKIMGMSAVATLVAPIVIAASCGNNERGVTVRESSFKSISEAQHKIWFDFSNLIRQRSDFFFKENIDLTIKNNGITLNLKFSKHENRKLLPIRLNKGVMMATEKQDNDISMLGFIDDSYMWNMAVLSRMPNNNPLNINNSKAKNFPFIVATKVSTWLNPWNILIHFELSNGQILSSVYDFTKGLNKKMTIINAKWNMFNWTVKPNNLSKSVAEIYTKK